MFLNFALCLLVLACLFNIYMLFWLVKSKGKNPPFIPSFGAPKKEMIKQASQFLEQNPNIKVADLGCGSGTLLILLAKKFPNHQFVGYEWDSFPCLLARLKSRKLSNLQIFKKDFFQEDLSQYRLVLCYLGNSIEDKIGAKLNQELTRDSLVISEVFKIGILKLKQEISVTWGIIKAKIYLYTTSR